ncbi:MAG: fluoride efflux transporter CrcB [Gemmatimonadaceae bacterium]|nr:fluoride efflux transporter CrcB [Gemmatimonadaceae bacterium]MCW5825338.1 fluoride efflux transporter CrcB [Gemmatimonadaceae bacterium]
MPSLPILLGVAGGGAFGSLLRFSVGRLLPVAAGTLPWSTLAINVLGSLALGALAGAGFDRPDASPALRAFLGVGLLGGFTTFSTFSLETVSLFHAGAPLRAVAYATLSVVASVGAAALGFALARS